MKQAATLPGKPKRQMRKFSGAEPALGTDGPASSQLALDLAKSAVIDRAIQVIGDTSEAMRWLGTPIRALDYATPVSMLHQPEGRQAVLSVLGRLEHGIL